MSIGLGAAEQTDAASTPTVEGVDDGDVQAEEHLKHWMVLVCEICPRRRDRG